MNKFIIAILVTICMASCRQFDGKISTNDDSSVILTNTSQSQKFQFTIKTTVEYENGNKTSRIKFQQLEPGEEKVVGKSVAFVGDKYYGKQLYDSVKEYIHLDQIVKQSKSSTAISKEIAKFKNEKYTYTQEYLTTYTKNGINYDPANDSPFGRASWKKIDSSKKRQIQVITYLAPSGIILDKTKPKKQEKIIYRFEIKGQRIIN